MSKSFLLILGLFLIALNPLNVFAQEATTTTTATPTTTLKEKVQTTREAAKDAIVAAKEEFKAKLAAIKDERKKALVENIDSKIKSKNEKHTTKMSEYLEKLTGVIDRISSQEATLKAEGKDTTKLMADIIAAKSALTRAQAAVDAQAAKTYTATITTDELLKNAVGATVSKFRSDLKAVFDLVKAAKAAVLKARIEVKSLSVSKSNNAGTATRSAVPNN